MTATFHHGEWFTTRDGTVTICAHVSGWAAGYSDGDEYIQVSSPAYDWLECEWAPVDAVAQIPDLMAALVEFVEVNAKPLGLPGLDHRYVDPEPDAAESDPWGDPPPGPALTNETISCGEFWDRRYRGGCAGARPTTSSFLMFRRYSREPSPISPGRVGRRQGA